MNPLAKKLKNYLLISKVEFLLSAPKEPNLRVQMKEKMLRMPIILMRNPHQLL